MSTEKFSVIGIVFKEILFPLLDSRIEDYEKFASEAHGKVGNEFVYYKGMAEAIRAVKRDLELVLTNGKDVVMSHYTPGKCPRCGSKQIMAPGGGPPICTGCSMIPREDKSESSFLAYGKPEYKMLMITTRRLLAHLAGTWNEQLERQVIREPWTHTEILKFLDTPPDLIEAIVGDDKDEHSY